MYSLRRYVNIFLRSPYGVYSDKRRITYLAQNYLNQNLEGYMKLVKKLMIFIAFITIKSNSLALYERLQGRLRLRFILGF